MNVGFTRLGRSEFCIVGADLCVRPIARVKTRKNGRTHRQTYMSDSYENREPSPRRSGESRNPFLRLLPFFSVLQCSRASVGKEMPPCIHPHPQMDSGFRRNDGQLRTTCGNWAGRPRGGAPAGFVLLRSVFVGTGPCACPRSLGEPARITYRGGIFSPPPRSPPLPAQDPRAP